MITSLSISLLKESLPTIGNLPGLTMRIKKTTEMSITILAFVLPNIPKQSFLLFKNQYDS